MNNQKGDSSNTFLSLLIPNQKRILAYILAYVPNFQDAEDILQDTISVLWKKFEEYKPDTDFVGFALTIARYEIMNYFRKSKRRNKLHMKVELQKIIEEEAVTVQDEYDYRADALKACFSKLVISDKRIMQMRYEQDLSLKAIGQRAGVTPSAILKKISLIQSRLIRCIRLRLATDNV